MGERKKEKVKQLKKLIKKQKERSAVETRIQMEDKQDAMANALKHRGNPEVNNNQWEKREVPTAEDLSDVASQGSNQSNTRKRRDSIKINPNDKEQESPSLIRRTSSMTSA